MWSHQASAQADQHHSSSHAAGPSHHHNHHHHHSHHHQSNNSHSDAYYSAPQQAEHDHGHASGSHHGNRWNYFPAETSVSAFPFPSSPHPSSGATPYPSSQQHQDRSDLYRAPQSAPPLTDHGMPSAHSSNWLPPPQPYNTSWMNHGLATTNPPAWPEDTNGGNGSYQLPNSGLDSLSSSLPPVRAPNKGKGKDLDSSWSDDLNRDFKRVRRDGDSDVDVEKDISQLQTNLTDLLGYIRPFVPSSDQPAPPKPPPYLYTRFARLSEMIHASLVKLGPHVHPVLIPGFALSQTHRSNSPSKFPALPSRIPAPNKRLEDMTPAEREMEIIRKRRDALITKAASAHAHAQPQAHLPTASSSAETPLSAMSHIARRQHSGSLPPVPGYGQSYANGQSHMNGNTNDNGAFGNLAALTEASELASQAQSQGKESMGRVQLDRLSPRSMALNGRCHGCGASVTSEWHRGPDGPESLCEPCGMHYARLLAKKDAPVNSMLMTAE